MYREASFHADKLFPALILGSIPAAILGLSFEKIIEEKFHHPLSVIIPLCVVGLALWLVDKKFPAEKNLDHLTVRDAFIVGLAQACALVPGVSRSGATMLCGRYLGYDKNSAATFSFLLGTPAFAGAALLHLKDLIAFSHDPSVGIGILTSCMVGCLAIKFLLSFLRKFSFLPFAIYRVLLSLVLAALLFR